MTVHIPNQRVADEVSILNLHPHMSVEEAVFQALGAASVCWDHMEGAGVFLSDRAEAIGQELLDFLSERSS